MGLKGDVFKLGDLLVSYLHSGSHLKSLAEIRGFGHTLYIAQGP